MGLLQKDLAKPRRNSAHRKSGLLARKKVRKQLTKPMNNWKNLSVAKCESSGLGPQGQEGLDSLLFNREKVMEEDCSQI